jgi:urease accessory protein
MDGKRPETVLQGLLSGLGHPVIGPDHLAFIVAIGIASAFVPAGLAVPLGFVAASALGVIAHLASVPVPMVELLVALSVVGAGVMLFSGAALGRGFWMLAAIGGGLLHGYALAETIIGAERGVLGAYVVGIAVVSFAIAAAAHAIARVLTRPLGGQHPRIRAAGAALGCVGIALTVLALIPGAP